MNRELIMDEAISNRDSTVKEVIEIFLEADVDGSGALSWMEFQEFMNDERIKAFFMSLELDLSSISRIFNLLDPDGDQSLDPQEFVEGCIELRGNAKKVDVTLIQRELNDISEKLDKVTKELSEGIVNVSRATAGLATDFRLHNKQARLDVPTPERPPKSNHLRVASPPQRPPKSNPPF